MKKIILLVLSFFLLGISYTFGDSSLVNNFEVPDNSYIYFYGQGCSHCAKLDNYLEKTDGYKKLSIEKKEIYFDKDNRAEMLEAGKALGLKEDEIGVPFFLVKTAEGESISLMGDEDIISYIKPYLGEINSSEADNKKMIVLLILGALGVIIPLMIIFLPNKNK